MSVHKQLSKCFEFSMLLVAFKTKILGTSNEESQDYHAIHYNEMRKKRRQLEPSYNKHYVATPKEMK